MYESSVVHHSFFYGGTFTMQTTAKTLTRIPKGNLGLIPIRGSEALAQKINDSIVRIRKQYEIEHQDSILLGDYHRDSYLLNVELDRKSVV